MMNSDRKREGGRGGGGREREREREGGRRVWVIRKKKLK